MMQIKDEYRRLFKVDLEKDVKDDVSGDYGQLLLLLAQDPSLRNYNIKMDGKEIVAEPQKPHVIEQVEEEVIEQTPTLRDNELFNAKDDCEKLRKAMKGFGTDEKAIISIICKRSNKQRLELIPTFKQIFDRSLIADLDDEISGDFKKTILGLMKSPAEFDAWAFRAAIQVC
jgi:hypothetical protein